MSEGKQKRLFIGLALSETLSSQFHDMVKKLRISADKRELEIKWSPQKNLHLTLKFIGDVDEEKIPLIVEKLRGLVPTISHLDLEISGMGGFPDDTQSRVVWVGAHKKKDLRDLQDQIEAAMIEIGLPESTEDFVPHVTVGRLRNKKSIKDFISPFVRKDFGKTHIAKVTLFESQLQGHYPVYIPIEEFPLKA